MFYSTKIGWNAESGSYTERQSKARVSYDNTPIKEGSTSTLRKKERKTVFSHTYVLVRKRERKDDDRISDIVIALSSIVPRVLVKRLFTRIHKAILITTKRILRKKISRYLRAMNLCV